MEETKNYEPKSDNNRGFSDNNKKKTNIKGEPKPEHDDDKNMTEKTNVKLSTRINKEIALNCSPMSGGVAFL